MLTPKHRAATLTAAYYAAVFMAFGAQLPYWPIWLKNWGLSETEIGFYLGAATIARIAGTTLLPALADRYAIRRWLIAGTAVCAAATMVAHLLVGQAEMLLAITLVYAVLAAPTVPVGEALGIRASERYGFAYGPVRAVGSIAFLSANVGVGALIGSAGIDAVVWAVSGGLLLTAMLATVHPGGGAPAKAADRATTADLKALAMTPVFAVFVLTTALGQAGHVVYYIYSSLEWQASGISTATIGWLWAVGVMAETVLMLGPGRIWVLKLGPERALALAALAGVARWGLMSLEPGLDGLWPLQAMHALTFGLAHLAAIAFVARAIPPRVAASAIGVVSGVIGGSIQAAAMAAAAMLTARYGIHSAYIMAAGMALASSALALMLGRLWNGNQIIPSDTADGPAS